MMLERIPAGSRLAGWARAEHMNWELPLRGGSPQFPAEHPHGDTEAPEEKE